MAKTRAITQLCQRDLELLCASAIFRDPLLVVHNREQQLDEVGMELADSMKELLVEAKEKLHVYYEQIVKIEPHRLLGRKMVDLNNLQSLSLAAIHTIINKGRIKLTAQENRLAALNPKSVLKRGYSITTNRKTGKVVARLGDIEIGDTVATELADRNLFESRVTKK